MVTAMFSALDREYVTEALARDLTCTKAFCGKALSKLGMAQSALAYLGRRALCQDGWGDPLELVQGEPRVHAIPCDEGPW